MGEHGDDLPASDPRPRVFGSAKGLIHMADDFDSPLLSEPAAVTSMLEQAIRAAKALPEDDQDALAAAMVEWIEDERRWAESFARTHEVLAELAREALTEHHAGQTRDREVDYAEMAADESREAEAVEWSDALMADSKRAADT